MKITYDSIVNRILASSALAAAIDKSKCASLLTAGNEPLLRLMTRNEACTLSLELMHFLTGIDLGNDNPASFTFTFADSGADSDECLRSEIENMLACGVLGHALESAGMNEGDYYLALRDSHARIMCNRLCGQPSALAANRY